MDNLPATARLPKAPSLNVRPRIAELTRFLERRGKTYSLPDRASPNEDERASLERHASDLTAAMQPPCDPVKALKIYIVALFKGYHTVRMTKEEADSTAHLYISQLKGFPEWAIVEACTDQMRKDSPFPPSIGQLYSATAKIVAPYQQELRQLKNVLEATVYHIPTQEDRDLANVKFQEIVKALRLNEDVPA